MKFPIAIGLWLMLLCCVGCGSDGEQQAPGNGGSPEEVVRRYQSLVDQNEFEAAKALSTPAEQANLDKLDQSISPGLRDQTVMHTRFIRLECETGQKVAECYCEVEDEYEQYAMTFRLIRVRGKWLVDAPDNNQLQEEVLEDMDDRIYLNEQEQ